MPVTLLLRVRPCTMPCVTSSLKGSCTGQTPASCRALVMNLAYSKCRIACSMPPIYMSTGMRNAAAAPQSSCEFLESRNRRKYQLLSTNVSIVSVSRSKPVCNPLRLKVGCRLRGDGDEYGAFVTKALTAAVAADAADGLLRICSACCCCMCCIIRSSEMLGSRTGRSDASTSCGPLEELWMMGMGQPQYRCLEMSQSRRA